MVINTLPPAGDQNPGIPQVDQIKGPQHAGCRLKSCLSRLPVVEDLLDESLIPLWGLRWAVCGHRCGPLTSSLVKKQNKVSSNWCY
ncbi:hypothetical protein CHARACLAT_010863 [Characodon lateralis]|uniref:Uncharacterized protein n=1 Tax=Characodon lateralis TaxID=208331 RepID=A0ABU7D5R0_9TELE|nr:hypothetical protein [Characodon lateralis]